MTNELRKLIKTQLNSLKPEYGIKEVYYRSADDDKLYPHIVFYFDGVNSLTDDVNRLDYKLIIDVWDKGLSSELVETVTDAIVELLSAKNLPQDEILPTFYFENSRSILDEDKDIKHNQLRFNIQSYER